MTIHRILWDVITYPCLRYLILAPLDSLHIDGLMQERRNSIAYALELRLSCTNPSIYRADSRFTPSQWDTSLQSNVVSQWLDANLESAVDICGCVPQGSGHPRTADSRRRCSHRWGHRCPLCPWRRPETPCGFPLPVMRWPASPRVTKAGVRTRASRPRTVHHLACHWSGRCPGPSRSLWDVCGA